MADRAQRPQSRTALVASVAFGIIVAAAGTVGWRWYHYVTAGASPYDEVGIEVNRRLPESLRDWGCARIKERFPRAVPPYGCQPGQVSGFVTSTSFLGASASGSLQSAEPSPLLHQPLL